MCLGTAGCFSSLNPSDLKCSKKEGCPSNYVCSSSGTCVPGTLPNDASPDGKETSPASSTDGSTELSRGSGGATSSLDGPIATGGSGGSTSSLDGPIATDGSGGATSSLDGSIAKGGSGGTSSSPDAPIATGGSGGTTSSLDGPIATGGSGGTTTSPDAPIAAGGKGGTTSLPDAPIATGGSGGSTSLPDAPLTLNPGSVCSSATASQCSGGACVDGHCCSVASCGTCQSCTGPGGTCVAVTNADDPDSCTGASTCNASGACKTKTGQACTTGAQCVSGNCADAICCNTACNGSCEYCNGSSPGTCSFVSGAPQTGHPACAGTGLCQGTCNGTKASCTLPGAETTCRQPSCEGTPPTATKQAVCDGNGNCPTLSTTPCSPFQCGVTSCLASCSSSTGQCVSGAACVGGTCQSCGSLSVCGNACVDTNTDPNHCGGCPASCTSGTPHCVSGRCVQCAVFTDCPTGYLACSSSGTCVCRQKSSTNLVQNPAFDGSLASWTLLSPFGGAPTYNTDDSDACPGSGSLYLGSFGAEATQCIPIGENVSYNFGFQYKGIVSCSTTYFSDSNCNNSIGPGLNLADGNGSISWAYLSGSHTTIPGTQYLMVLCDMGTGAGWYDQFYVNIGGGSF